MKTFVDTSALLAILDAQDPNHERATSLLKALLMVDEVFTHNYIHVEAEQLVRRRLGAEAATRLLVELLPAVQTLWVDEAIHAEAVRSLAGKGRAMSLVDQVSFAVMRSLKVNTALAFDADFEDEGIRLPNLPERRRHELSETPAPYGPASDATELVSVAELAARSGRSVNTIQSWRRRHPDFPAPNVELAAGPIWRWGDVSAWIDRRSQRTTASAGR
jgi:predicted nucleic acid-binding protein